jgi:hypothetical protein
MINRIIKLKKKCILQEDITKIIIKVEKKFNLKIIFLFK